MGIFDGIEKLINEHGSAVILNQQLALAKEQFTALERQVSELQTKSAKFEAQLEIEHANHQRTSEELQRLKDEHSEEVRIHNGIEFRRGKRTNQKWIAFCPACHLPIDTSSGLIRCGSDKKCGWHILLAANHLTELIDTL
jgi:hypothetical protein